MKKLLVFVIALSALATRSNAQNLVVNGSFETGLTNWLVFGVAASRNDEGSTDGSYSCVFNYGNVTPGGTLYQTFATDPGATYSFTFDYGAFGAANSQALYVFVMSGSSLEVFDNVAPTGTGPTTFADYSKSFKAHGSTTTLEFNDLATFSQGFNTDMILDNVSVVKTAAAPEASSLVLSGSVAFGCGAFGLLRRFHRR